MQQENSSGNLELVMQAGFVAAAMGMVPKAITIFRALRLARPESEYPVLGLALTLINMGHFKDAAKTLIEDGFKANPDSDLVRAMLGLCMHLGGRGEDASKLFKQVIDANREPTAVRLAERILSEEANYAASTH